MPVIYRRPKSIAAVWSRRVGYFAIVLISILWGLHRFGYFSTPDTILVGFVASAFAATGLGLSIIGLFMLWYNGSKGGKASFVGLCFSLLALLPLGLATFRYATLPQQFDVSTSEQIEINWLVPPERPPSWLSNESSGGILLPLKNNRIYGQLNERRYQGAIDRVYNGVAAVIRSEKLKVIATEGDDFLSPIDSDPENSSNESSGDENATENVPIPAPPPAPRNFDLSQSDQDFEGSTIRIQLEMRSFILGLDHDIMIVLTEDEAATFVHMRAATRYGPHDLGLNAELMNRFLTKLDNNLLGIVGSN